jgi:hypothetical protein
MTHWAAMLLLTAIALTLAACAGTPKGRPAHPPPPPLEEDPARLGAGIQRSVTLMATSTPERRHPVRVLFYGQSITVQDWWREVAEDLRRRFPHADLTVENRAIGGFASQRLVRTAEHDLYPFYPDLLIFHVLGDHRRYEDIIRRTRSRTTAEVAIWNDHVNWLPTGDAEADEGRMEGYEWSRKMSYEFIPSYARRYGCYLMDIRTEWRRYLEENGLDPGALLRDGVHLNEHGNYVLAELIKRRLVRNPSLPDRAWQGLVQTHQVGRDLRWQDGRLRLEFEGNRVDALAAEHEGRAGRARVLVDGRPPSEFPELCVFSRPSGTANIGWPAIMRVGSDAPLVVETWTARITEINDAADEFAFEVFGSKTGPDGAGRSGERFVSDSGRVVIEPDDWCLAYDRRVSGKPTPAGFESTWRVVPMFVDLYEPREVEDPSREYATTLAQGLPNERHTLELIAEDGRAAPIRAIRVFRPPVR